MSSSCRKSRARCCSNALVAVIIGIVIVTCGYRDGSTALVGKGGSRRISLQLLANRQKHAAKPYLRKACEIVGSVVVNEGPKDAGVAYINEFSKERYDGNLLCTWTAEKGRALHSARDYTQGDVILRESPQLIVQADPKSPAYEKLVALHKANKDVFFYDPIWYWCALRSLTTEHTSRGVDGGWEGVSQETQDKLLLLHHDMHFPGTDEKLIVEHICPTADVQLLSRLIQVWVLNCFEHSDEPEGFATFFFTSFMSHSCFPNSGWTFDDGDHVLRARRDIKAGDEVCISYLNDESTMQSAPHRRWDMYEHKLFWCNCERCGGKQDLSRGFNCPACKDGTVFAAVPEPGPVESGELRATELIRAQCSKCDYRLNKNQAVSLCKKEIEVQRMLSLVKPDESDRSPDAKSKLTDITAAQLFTMVEDGGFAQHVIADLSREQLIDFYREAGDFLKVLKLLEKRRAFFEGAYPSLNGAHADILEEIADVVQEDAATAAMFCRKAWTINSCLYGPDDPASKLSQGKYEELMTRLRASVKAAAAAEAAPNRKDISF